MPAPEQNEDGRVARKVENRTRIMEALFALVQAGRLHPTLREIAEEAGLTSRTLLNHFPDVGALVLAAAAYGKERARSGLPLVRPELEPTERVHAFFRDASAFFDAYSAIRWATLTFPGELPGFDKGQRGGHVLRQVEQRMEELLTGFGASLTGQRELRRALLVVIDPLAWRLLRVQQGLSRAEAARSMAVGVLALAKEAARVHKPSAKAAFPRRRVVSQ